MNATSPMMKLRITVEQCIDAECFVWSLLAYDGGVYMDGYAATEDDAWDEAREARAEVYATWQAEPGHA